MYIVLSIMDGNHPGRGVTDPSGGIPGGRLLITTTILVGKDIAPIIACVIQTG